MSHDKRHGTTNLYAALDVASGNVIADLSARHRAEEFRRFLNLIDKSVPAHLAVHVIVDNSFTHKASPSSVLDSFCKLPRTSPRSRDRSRGGIIANEGRLL